ncbi:MAG: 2OG-Fe(II) oxygenase family protein [Allosphingosinicella sp.]
MERLAAGFGRHRRVHIADFLMEEDAEALLRHLRGDPGWRVAIRHGDKRYEFSPADFTDKQRESLNRVVRQANPDGIHYCFQTVYVPEGEDERAADPTPLNLFADFLSSAPILSLVKAITGANDVLFADGQATAYGPGDFLSMHNDDQRDEKRRAAYSFGLSPSWDVDWGGLLLFPGADGHVERAYTPAFNALNLFAVPQRHCVTLVAPFAESRRYSVSGWFRGGERSPADQPPSPPPDSSTGRG